MTVTVHCGDAIYKSFFERGLETQGIHVGSNAEFQLLVDKPTGWALLDHFEVDYSRCIILSENLCTHYGDKSLRQSSRLIRAGELPARMAERKASRPRLK